MRRTGPDSKEHKATAYVFGNAVGEHVGSIKTAWKAACRRAGISGLHFHDLRREAASTPTRRARVGKRRARDPRAHRHQHDFDLSRDDAQGAARRHAAV